jgi:1,4-dihydroxy-2-naphthoyl-CoA hydrolase
LKIWKQVFSIEALNEHNNQTMVTHLGIEFIEAGDDFLRARMPVDHRTHQPMGILHGGASVALAETVGSVASALCTPDLLQGAPVGLDINANHIRSVSEGFVVATCRPYHIGRTTHVWHIEITDELSGKLVCISRLTMAIRPV